MLSNLKRLLLLSPALLLSACSTSVESLPLGEVLYRMIVGGPSISEATLIRFYAWHVVGLSIPIALLIVWHGFRVRRDGGISSPVREPGDPPHKRVDRAVIVRGETLSFFLTIAALLIVSALVEPPLGPKAEPGLLVEHTDAPWIFLWVQELLRIWPPAIAGVLVPAATVIVLAALPFLDWKNDGVAVWFNRQGRVVQIVLIVLFVAILALTVRAALR